MTTDVEGTATTEPATGQVVGVAEALGMAWGAQQLYPDPTHQPAFTRAVDLLRSAPAFPLKIEVGPGLFIWQGEEVPVSREGARRLALRLYLHDVAFVELVGPPSEGDLLALLEVAAAEDDQIRARGGVRAALAAKGVSAIVLHGQSPLKDAVDDETAFHRDPETVELFEMGRDPESFAASLFADSAGDVAGLVRRFLSFYTGAYHRIQVDDVIGRERVVRIFVETFFYLPEETRPPLVEGLLGRRGELPVRVFLDQFSGHDLATLAGDLAAAAAGELREYARVAVDSDDGGSGELLHLLQPITEVEEAKRAVADRVARLVREGAGRDAGEAIASIRRQLAGATEDMGIGMDILRELLRVEIREARLRRSLRIWVARILRLLRSGDTRMAATWTRAVIVDPPYPLEAEAIVREELNRLASRSGLVPLVDALGKSDDDDSMRFAADMLQLLGGSAVGALVELLADEESAARRRLLIDLLAAAAGDDPAPLLKHADDPRWYVARNLATVLGKTRHPGAAPALEHLTRHDDQRVRVEAIRGLVPLDRDRSWDILEFGLRDAHQRVRQAASSFLRNAEDDRADHVLAVVAGDDGADLDARLGAIGVLGERETRIGDDALAALAGKQLALRAQDRALRKAARTALGGRR